MIRTGFRVRNLPHAVQEVNGTQPGELDRALNVVRRGQMTGALVLGNEALRLLDSCEHLDASARNANWVNLVTFADQGQLAGYNTVYLGALDLLQEEAIHAPRVSFIGSGPCVSAIAAACTAVADTQVAVTTSRSWTSTEALHESEAACRLRDAGILTALWPSAVSENSSHFSSVMRLQFADLVASSELLLQTTRATMVEGPDCEGVLQAVPWDRLKRDVVVCDLAYRPEPGPFAKAAQDRGLRTLSGLEMMVRQAARTVHLWTGVRPPTAPMLEAARRAMTEQRA
jgi:shikimate 5-dehydrogenase